MLSDREIDEVIDRISYSTRVLRERNVSYSSIRSMRGSILAEGKDKLLSDEAFKTKLTRALQNVSTQPGAFRDIKLNGSELCFVTEPIHLRHVNLGDFEIRLNLDRWRGYSDTDSLLSIHALHPAPNAPSNYPHPHVSGNSLCQGEAGSAIRASIGSRNLVNVAIIVNSVLHTYNPDSPFRSLEHYENPRCSVCNHPSSDQCYTCRTIVCSSDMVRCQRCGNSGCPSCYAYIQVNGSWGYYCPEHAGSQRIRVNRTENEDEAPVSEVTTDENGEELFFGSTNRTAGVVFRSQRRAFLDEDDEDNSNNEDEDDDSDEEEEDDDSVDDSYYDNLDDEDEDENESESEESVNEETSEEEESESETVQTTEALPQNRLFEIAAPNRPAMFTDMYGRVMPERNQRAVELSIGDLLTDNATEERFGADRSRARQGVTTGFLEEEENEEEEGE